MIPRPKGALPHEPARDIDDLCPRDCGAAGTIQSPPAFAEGMYNSKITGLGLAGKLEIVKSYVPVYAGQPRIVPVGFAMLQGRQTARIHVS
jgi:hypothetical protein